jgi:hypothetical protein
VASEDFETENINDTREKEKQIALIQVYFFLSWLSP